MQIIDQQKGRRVRTNDDPRQDIAEHNRLLHTPEQEADHRRDDHDNGEVLEECNVMHERLTY